MNNTANIRATAVQVYIGSTGTDPNNLNEWSTVGYTEAGKTLIRSAAQRYRLNGFTRGLGRVFEFVAYGLQTTNSDRAILEIFEGKKTDILLTALPDEDARTVLRGFNFEFAPEYVFSDALVLRNVLRGIRKARNLFQAVLLLDEKSPLIAMDNWGVIN